jgi:hypothetical protein
MPEIKQNFTKGKMNKDLDERLIPKGEYREAQNIHISESEGSDVGAIENILSTDKLTTAISGLGTNSSGEGYDVIGYCKDLANKRVVYFITNFSSTTFVDDIRGINRALNVGTRQYTFNLGHDCAIVLYDIENKNQKILAKGPWLNFSKNHLITGSAIIEDLLFWTDNLNQPRKININTAVEEGPDYYDCEENISVAKYAPYKAIMLSDDEASNSSLPTIDPQVKSEYTKERFIRFSYRYKYEDGEYSLIAPFTQAVFEPLNGGKITNSDDDDERNSTANEPKVLTGKKEVYKKGLVDIMQNRINTMKLMIPLPNKDEFKTGAANPSAGSYDNPYKIKEIDILLKESNGISFKLVKTIKIDEVDTNDILVYTHQSRSDTDLHKRHALRYQYTSTEPTSVLPESQVNRVYDQVPLMAKTLEAVGNRIVFGNYVENYNYPTDVNNRKGINYTVTETTKGQIDQAGQSASEPYVYGLKQWLSKTYKYHTVKQRRTYQVGIVFSDVFGRQSPVILSSNKEFDNPDTITVSPETNNYGANTNAVWDDTIDSYGKSLSIKFEENDLTNDDKFVASLPFGLNSEYQKRLAYNPHGWYSYRIVVKQQEQEYYNVYAPHAFDGWDNVKEAPNDSLSGGRSWLSLHGDNINKIPRSINDSDVNREGTMGSDVRLYPKVVFSSRTGLKPSEVDVNDLLTNQTDITQEANTDVTFTLEVGVTAGVTTSGDGSEAIIKLTSTCGPTENQGTITALEVVEPGVNFKSGDTITITEAAVPQQTAGNIVITLAAADVFNTEGESKQNTSYHELAEVISLGTMYEQNLYISGDDNKSGTGGFTGYKFIYGKDKNPLVAEIQNLKAYTGDASNNKAAVYFARTDKTKQTTFNLDSDQLGTAASIADDELNDYSINFTSLALHTDVTVTDTTSSQQAITLSSPQTVIDADKLVFSKYYEGLSVFETEPFFSNIDIYYETSTSGLVADLVKEIVVDQADLPTGLTIKQDTYSFGAGQDPLGTSGPQYGSRAFLYENTPSGTNIGDLDATEPANATTKNLSFSLRKATVKGTNENVTNKFTIALVSSTYKVQTNGDFVFTGSNDTISLLIAITDESVLNGQTAYLEVQVEVKNSVPTITSLPSSLDVRVDAGDNAKVISSSNNYTNGGTLASGFFNKYSDVDITHSFTDPSLNNLFKIVTEGLEDGKYELRTTGDWDIESAQNFFARSGLDGSRTVTITATDSGGLSATTSTRIDEDDIVVVNGLIYKYEYQGQSFNEYSLDNVQLALKNDQIEIWATAGSSGVDPVHNDYNDVGAVQVFVNNKIFTHPALTSTLSAGEYVFVTSYTLGQYSGVTQTVDIVEISSTGTVASIEASYTIND